jgi:hypothetical protein
VNEPITSKLDRLRRAALIAGITGLASCGLGAALNSRQFFISYLVGYTFWLGLSLGCMGVTMMHHLTGGRWGFVTRRFLEAGFMTLPLMALLFVPLLFGLHTLYPWTQPGLWGPSHALQLKAIYLNTHGFCIRATIYLAIWLVMAFYLRRWSLAQEDTDDTAPTVRLRALSGPGIVIYPVIATFAFVDWVMTIEPKWYSTMFPVIILIGQVLSAFAFTTLLLAWFRDDPPFQGIVNRTHLHDLGNLLLAFVVFWTYVSFGQLLIIYSSNLPQEIDWYLHRIAGGWRVVIGVLTLFHFFVPFFLLLFRVMKQRVARLALIAGLVFAVHMVEVYWTIEPTFFPQGLHVHWLDFAALIGLGGIWLALFAWNLRRHPLLVRNDPRLQFRAPELAHAK